MVNVVGKKYENIENFLGRFERSSNMVIKDIVDSFLAYNPPLDIDELKEEISLFVADSSLTDEEKNNYIKLHMEIQFADESLYLSWLKLEGEKMPAINDDLINADYQEMGMEQEMLESDIRSLKRELLAKEKRLAGVKQELTRRDESASEEECCSKCGGDAGFETSPEGDNCGLCNEWVCQECTDASASMQQWVLPSGKLIAEDVICKVCATLTGIHELQPVPISIKDLSHTKKTQS